MNELIEKVKQWGVDKGITGPDGKGTLEKQSRKFREEAFETIDAIQDRILLYRSNEDISIIPDSLVKIKDGIGDSIVTLILLAEMCDLNLEECLQHAYDEIKDRKGSMQAGTFVKNFI